MLTTTSCSSVNVTKVKVQAKAAKVSFEKLNVVLVSEKCKEKAVPKITKRKQHC